MKPTFRTALVAAVAGGTALMAARSADAQELRRVTLDEALALFARNSLDLRMVRAEAAEAAALARQAGAYPNLVVAGTHEPLADGQRTHSESYLNLSQRLEWPGTRNAREEAALRTANAARGRFVADSARLAFEVKEAYVHAARAQQAVDELVPVTEIFREGERDAEERYQSGDVSLYDRRRISIERIRYESRLSEAGLEAAAARRRLALLVVPEGDVLELSPVPGALSARPPTIAGGRALATALATRREIAAAEATVASARAAAALARGERIPDVTATAGYKRQSDGLAGAFLGLSLPVPLWDRRGGAIEAAEAGIRAAEHRASLTRRQVENDVLRALETHRSLASRAELLEAPPADGVRDLLEIARVAYDEGEMELLDLLDAADAHMEVRLSGVRLRAEFWTSYYDLERAVGGFDEPAEEREDER